MSIINMDSPLEREMHYSDGSHRWIGPKGIDWEVWEAGIREHQAAHRAELGGTRHGHLVSTLYLGEHR